MLTYSQNHNSYCFNNPLRYSDPTGFSAYNDPWTQQDGRYHSVEEQIAALFNGGQWSDILLASMQGVGGGQKNEVGKPEVGGNIRFDSATGKWVYADGPLKGKEASSTYVKEYLRDYGKYNESQSLFNSTLVRILIPDRISISISLNIAIVAGEGRNIELNWILRGKDASCIPFVTNTLSKRYGFEGDAGIQLNRYWFNGPSNQIRKEFVYGPSQDFDGGYLVGGCVCIGQNDSGDVLWYGIGGGVGGTLFGSYGRGHTSPDLTNNSGF
jgi:hypothetical protein